jgi:hypothetical protein
MQPVDVDRVDVDLVDLNPVWADAVLTVLTVLIGQPLFGEVLDPSGQAWVATPAVC